MAKEGFWGETLEIMAAAAAFGVNVSVHVGDRRVGGNVVQEELANHYLCGSVEQRAADGLPPVVHGRIYLHSTDGMNHYQWKRPPAPAPPPPFSPPSPSSPSPPAPPPPSPPPPGFGDQLSEAEKNCRGALYRVILIFETIRRLRFRSSQSHSSRRSCCETWRKQCAATLISSSIWLRRPLCWVTILLGR